MSGLFKSFCSSNYPKNHSTESCSATDECLTYLENILEDSNDEQKEWKAEFLDELKKEYKKYIDAGFEPGKPLPVESGETEFDDDGEPIETKPQPEPPAQDTTIPGPDAIRIYNELKAQQEFYEKQKPPKRRSSKMAKSSTLPRVRMPKTASIEALADSFSLSGDAVAVICQKQKVPIGKVGMPRRSHNSWMVIP